MLAINDIAISSNPTSPLDTGSQRLYPESIVVSMSVSFEREWQSDSPRTKVRLIEERYADSEFVATVNDPMCRASPQTVGPAFHHVSNVDNKRSRNGIDVDPGSRCGLDLQRAFSTIGEQKCNTAVIGVFPAADTAVVIRSIGRRWIRNGCVTNQSHT